MASSTASRSVQSSPRPGRARSPPLGPVLRACSPRSSRPARWARRARWRRSRRRWQARRGGASAPPGDALRPPCAGGPAQTTVATFLVLIFRHVVLARPARPPTIAEVPETSPGSTFPPCGGCRDSIAAPFRSKGLWMNDPPYNGSIEVVRGRIDDQRGAQILRFWAQNTDLGEDEARRRLDRGGLRAARRCRRDRGRELRLCRRAWPWSAAAASGSTAASSYQRSRARRRRCSAAPSTALAEGFDHLGQDPVGLCVLVGDARRDAAPAGGRMVRSEGHLRRLSAGWPAGADRLLQGREDLPGRMGGGPDRSRAGPGPSARGGISRGSLQRTGLGERAGRDRPVGPRGRSSAGRRPSGA